MEQEEQPRRTRQTEHPRFQVGEYVFLTQQYRGMPEGSVGEITKVSSTRPPRYRIYFGEALPARSFPETVLAPLKARRLR